MMIKSIKSQRGSVEVIVAIVAVIVLASAAYLVYNRQSSNSGAASSFLPHSSAPMKVTTTTAEKADTDTVEADSEMNAAADEDLNDIDISNSDLQ
jgi:hypothetical protein